MFTKFPKQLYAKGAQIYAKGDLRENRLLERSPEQELIKDFIELLMKYILFNIKVIDNLIYIYILILNIH